MDKDDLYDDAVSIIRETRKTTVANLQRRLRIGYNRAANLIEDMERNGVVSAYKPNGSRAITEDYKNENRRRN